MDELLHSEITGKIIKAFYSVYNGLGFGFLEKVYENALVIELLESGVAVEQQRGISVFYRGKLVGEYFADLIVDGCVVIELKSAVAISIAHEAQLLNYLRATDFEVGLLLNFGQKPEYKRKVFQNKKTNLFSVLLDP